MKCEMCGSENVKILTEERNIQVKYGSKEWYLSTEIICQECNSIILTEDSNKYYKESIDRSLENAVFKMLRILESSYSFNTFERVLGLDFGTLEEWKLKVKTPSKAEVALLYIITNNIDLIIHQHF